MFNYGNIQLKVCGITDQKSLEVIQKYSVRTVGLVSNYLYGPNTLSTEEIHNLTIASYNLKLNPILLIGNIHMPKIIDIIKNIFDVYKKQDQKLKTKDCWSFRICLTNSRTFQLSNPLQANTSKV